MNNKRLAFVVKAFEKLDRDKSGIVDINDIKNVYDVSQHPDYKSGKKTENEILGEFLETFETHHAIRMQHSKDQKVTYDEFVE